MTIKWLGAAYLIVAGIRMLAFSGKGKVLPGAVVASRRSVTLFSQGLITQLANPKAIVFFTALLPQFISPSARVFEQFMLLGVVSIAVEFPVLVTYGWLAYQGSHLIPEKFSSLSERIAGGFLISAGVGLAAIRRA